MGGSSQCDSRSGRDSVSAVFLSHALLGPTPPHPPSRTTIGKLMNCFEKHVEILEFLFLLSAGRKVGPWISLIKLVLKFDVIDCSPICERVCDSQL